MVTTAPARTDCPAVAVASYTGSVQVTTSDERRTAGGELVRTNVHTYDAATDTCTGCPPACEAKVGFRDFDGTAASMPCGATATRRLLVTDNVPTCLTVDGTTTYVLDVCDTHQDELREAAADTAALFAPVLVGSVTL